MISYGWQRTCCTESEEATAKDRGIGGRGGGGGGKGFFIVSFRDGGEIESDGRTGGGGVGRHAQCLLGATTGISEGGLADPLGAGIH